MSRPSEAGDTRKRTMSRRRSVVFIPVAVGALLAGIGAHLIDVDDLTPDEVVARTEEALASIGP